MLLCLEESGGDKPIYYYGGRGIKGFRNTRLVMCLRGFFIETISVPD